jgi:hypothetical protein
MHMTEATMTEQKPRSEAKQALLMRRLRAGGGQARRSQTIPARGSSEAPLSFGQERLWYLEQLEPNSPLYTMPVAFRLLGTLNRDALETAIGRIVDRHQVLRTRFVMVNGEPVQVAAPCVRFKLHTLKLHRPSRIEVERRLFSEARRPFDLSKDLMLKVTLLVVGEDDHILLLNMHHIASDGWSWAIFLSELTEFYSAAIARAIRGLRLLGTRPVQEWKTQRPIRLLAEASGRRTGGARIAGRPPASGCAKLPRWPGNAHAREQVAGAPECNRAP